MADNPFNDLGKHKASKVTFEMLQKLCASLNVTNLVRHSGKPYFIGKQVDEDGFATHFLDRQI